MEKTIKYNFIVLDLETSGINRINDDIIQIAAEIVTLENMKIVKNKDSFNKFIYSDKILEENKGAFAVHKITTKAIRKEKRISIIFDEFYKWMKKHTHKENPLTYNIMVAHNGLRFDFQFLYSKITFYNKLNIFEHLDYFFDTLNYCKETLNQKINKLGHLYKFLYGESIDNYHNALADVDALIKIMFNKKVFNLKNIVKSFVTVGDYCKAKPKYNLPICCNMKLDNNTNKLLQFNFITQFKLLFISNPAIFKNYITINDIYEIILKDHNIYSQYKNHSKKDVVRLLNQIAHILFKKLSIEKKSNIIKAIIQNKYEIVNVLQNKPSFFKLFDNLTLTNYYEVNYTQKDNAKKYGLKWINNGWCDVELKKEIPYDKITLPDIDQLKIDFDNGIVISETLINKYFCNQFGWRRKKDNEKSKKSKMIYYSFNT